MTGGHRPLESILAIAEGSLRASDLAERELWFAEASWTAAQAHEAMTADNIDVAPIRAEPIRQFLVRDELPLVPAGEQATAAAHAVDIVHLVTGDMGLAEALELLPSRGFLFVLEGGRVAGIITPSDVQRVPVSMVALALILAAEAGMSELIAAAYGSEPAWLVELPLPRRTSLDRRFHERERRNAEITRLDLLMLEDRLSLVETRATLREALGFPSRRSFTKWSMVLKRTRDDLAHGHTMLDVEPDPIQALRLIGRVREFATRVWLVASEEAPLA